MSRTTQKATAADGTSILVRRWAPTGDAWADVLLLHGLAEHSGRYEHVGSWMADAGLDVSAYDLRGFGGSGGRPAWVDRWSRHHDDLEERLLDIRSRGNARPLVLFGHSVGALVALGYVVAEQPRPAPDVLVISAPAIDDTLPQWQRVAARLLSGVAPTFEFTNAFDGTALSRDPAVAERYVADPLNRHRTTTQFGVSAWNEQARVRAAATRLSLPTLVIHGGEDRLVPTASSELFEGLPTVTRRVYPGLRHETHNEPEGAAVIAGVVAWLRSVLESRQLKTASGERVSAESVARPQTRGT